LLKHNAFVEDGVLAFQNRPLSSQTEAWFLKPPFAWKNIVVLFQTRRLLRGSEASSLKPESFPGNRGLRLFVCGQNSAKIRKHFCVQSTPFVEPTMMMKISFVHFRFLIVSTKYRRLIQPALIHLNPDPLPVSSLERPRALTTPARGKFPSLDKEGNSPASTVAHTSVISPRSRSLEK
jgi:hypothetical protein